MDFISFVPYLIVMAGVTYLVRIIPFVLMNKKIENRFINSFLYYTPYTVLSAMTFPAILYATDSMVSAAAGLMTAIFLAYRRKGRHRRSHRCVPCSIHRRGRHGVDLIILIRRRPPSVQLTQNIHRMQKHSRYHLTICCVFLFVFSCVFTLSDP